VRGESGEAGGVHAAGFGQTVDASDVHVAPVAAGSARGEAEGVAVGVDAVKDAVDPAEAEGFLDSLAVGEAGLARGFFVEADVELGRGCVVCF